MLPRTFRTLVLVTLLVSSCAEAQVLARPGWRGSGISVEPWWQSAVFYRIVPEDFQDSDGDGVGDLRGIAQRLEYLQALGIDAIVLQLPFDDAGFDDLLAEAARHRVRIVVGLPSGADDTRETAQLVPEAQHWLARGAAGILLRPLGADDMPGAEILPALRRAVAGFPGQRVLITPSPGEGQLTIMPVAAGSAGAVTALLAAASPGGELQPTAPPARVRVAVSMAPLLALQRSTSAFSRSNAAPLATALLTQRAAVLLESGQELGLQETERMPWTPHNVTRQETAPEPAPSVPARGPVVYGPYRPYVPPPKPKPPIPGPNGTVLPDPDSLPGFSSKALPPTSSPVPSVVQQERDANSLLNLYRSLIALHHGNATLRNGSVSVLHADVDVVAWLRRAPAGARTAASIVVAVNMGDRAATLSLVDAFARLHVHAGTLRSLLGGASRSGEETPLAPHGVFVGELVHGR